MVQIQTDVVAELGFASKFRVVHAYFVLQFQAWATIPVLLVV